VPVLIAQLSDVHVGGGRYREELLRTAIEEINTAAPDLVVVAGDLTDEGYPDQYPLAKEELSALACPRIVRVPGNHDALKGVKTRIPRRTGVLTPLRVRSFSGHPLA
jgi:3',5'-cyclic-AMP phosphodiesterase